MSISLNAETQKLIEERMKQGDFHTVDELVQVAIGALEQMEVPPLDEATLDAIGRAEAHIARGEYVGIDEVRREFEQRFKGK